MHSEELDWELIGSAGSMEALRPEWEALWERCPAATPFQSPSWQIAWWRYFGTGKLPNHRPEESRKAQRYSPCFGY